MFKINVLILTHGFSLIIQEQLDDKMFQSAKPTKLQQK